MQNGVAGLSLPSEVLKRMRPVTCASPNDLRHALLILQRRLNDKAMMNLPAEEERLADWLETGGGDESRSETVKRELERVGERTGAILSQAEEMGVDVLTICNVCTLNLRRANKMGKDDGRVPEKVNEEPVQAGPTPVQGHKGVTHPPVNPVPVIVTAVPPAAGPLRGDTRTTSGGLNVLVLSPNVNLVAPRAGRPKLSVKGTVAVVSSAMLWLAMLVRVGAELDAPSRLPVLVSMSQVTLESPTGRPAGE